MGEAKRVVTEKFKALSVQNTKNKKAKNQSTNI